MSRPPYGTSPIKCGNSKCDWTGKETDLIHHPDDAGKFSMRNVCPNCHCDEYTYPRRKRVHSVRLVTETTNLEVTHN